MLQKRTVLTNEAGSVIGQDHHRAKYTDHEVELMLRLVQVHGMSQRSVAAAFDASKSFVCMLVNGQRRNHTAHGQKEIVRRR